MADEDIAEGVDSDDEVEPEPEDDSDWAADALQNGARRKRKATVSAGSDDGNVVENDPDDDVSGGDEAASDADESDELEIRSTLSRSSATNRTQKRTTKKPEDDKTQAITRTPLERAARKRAGEMKEQQDAEELGLDEDEDSSDDDSDGSDGESCGENRKSKKHSTSFDASYVPIPDENAGDKVEQVLKHKRRDDCDTEGWHGIMFLIKWSGYSHLHNSWESLATLQQLDGYKRVENYMQKVTERGRAREHMTPEERESQDIELQMEEELLEQFKEVERVFAQEDSDDGIPRFLVKWKGLPYESATWERLEPPFVNLESANQEMQRFQEREERLRTVKSKNVEAQRRNAQKTGIKLLNEQPEYLKGGELRDYQLEGLNWLIYSWKQNNNCVLADEMGLGKTVQCAAMLGWLVKVMQILGPFMVVVPLSTVPNWSRELAKWVPSLNTVVYVGSTTSREIIRNYELFEGGVKGAQKRVKFDVLVTTYEVFLKDARLLQSISWAYLIADEAHRLKNSEGALHREMRQLEAANTLLVTGTPLQNNLRELWAILNFLEPEKFSHCEDFEERHRENMESSEGLNSLHSELKPHLLRRTVKDVEKSLPPKRERVLRIAMSPLQRQYYKWILQRNFNALNKGAKGSGQVTLLNVVMELKKCCNHPFLFESAEATYADSSGDVDALVRSSGKFALLDKLLHRFHEQGHRCLIFTQMVRMLDILSEYLKGRRFKFQRLDGSQPSQVRDHAVDHFNAPGSEDFCFILSTRAGGLGINLATADTVIIFDSDWNPKSDMQAMSRAHRIGQTETVNIYRFVTKDSVEEDILERAKQKMVLDHLVIQGMDTSGRAVVGKSSGKRKTMFSGEELSKVLRFGAEDLFKNDEEQGTERSADAGGNELCTDEDLDKILERADQNAPGENEQQGQDGAEGLLNRFKVASFDQEEDDATFWSRLIGEAAEDDQNGEYAEASNADRVDALDEDRPVRRAGEHAKGAMKEPGNNIKPTATTHQKQSNKAKRKGIMSKSGGTPLENAHVRVTTWPESNRKPLGRSEAARFAKATKHYRRHNVQAIRDEVQGQLSEASDKEILALYDCLMDSCKQVIKEAKNKGDDVREQVVDFYGASVKAAEHYHRSRELQLLAERARKCQSASDFVLDKSSQMRPPSWGKQHGWGQRQDAMLLLGIYRHGLGNWQEVVNDEELGLKGKIKVEEDASGAKREQVDARSTHLLKKLREAVDGLDDFELVKKEDKISSGATNAKSKATDATARNQLGETSGRGHAEEEKAIGGTHNDEFGKRKKKKDGNAGDIVKTKAEAKEKAGEVGEQTLEFRKRRQCERLTDKQMRTMMEGVWQRMKEFKSLRNNTSLGKSERLRQSQELIQQIGNQVDAIAAHHQRGGGDKAHAERVCWALVDERVGSGNADKLQAAYNKLRSKAREQQQASHMQSSGLKEAEKQADVQAERQ